MDQMDLPQIRGVWISPRMKKMLHFMAIVRISFDAQAGNLFWKPGTSDLGQHTGPAATKALIPLELAA